MFNSCLYLYLYFIFAMFHHHVDSCLYFNKSGRCHFSPLSSDEGLSPKIPPNRLLWKPPNFLTKKIEAFFACVSICLIALQCLIYIQEYDALSKKVLLWEGWWRWWVSPVVTNPDRGCEQIQQIPFTNPEIFLVSRLKRSLTLISYLLCFWVWFLWKICWYFTYF